MGARGPKPTPAALKLLRGNPGRRAVDLGDGVHPRVGAPSRPALVVGAAATEWKRIAPLLVELGLLTELDRAALTLYCTAWGDLVALRLQLNVEKKAAVARGESEAAAMWRTLPSGIQRPSVLSAMIDHAEQRLDRALAHFGLSPSQRARVTASRDVGSQLPLPGMPQDPVDDKLARLRVVQTSGQ